MEESLIKRLLATIKCGVCGQGYEIGSINVLGHHHDLWFVSALCPACHTRCLVVAVIKEGRVSEIVTDLTEAELDKFKDAARITPDEVLDTHSFLKDFDGDFSRLFSQE